MSLRQQASAAASLSSLVPARPSVFAAMAAIEGQLQAVAQRNEDSFAAEYFCSGDCSLCDALYSRTVASCTGVCQGRKGAHGPNCLPRSWHRSRLEKRRWAFHAIAHKGMAALEALSGFDEAEARVADERRRQEKLDAELLRSQQRLLAEQLRVAAQRQRFIRAAGEREELRASHSLPDSGRCFAVAFGPKVFFSRPWV